MNRRTSAAIAATAIGAGLFACLWYTDPQPPRPSLQPTGRSATAVSFPDTGYAVIPASTPERFQVTPASSLVDQRVETLTLQYGQPPGPNAGLGQYVPPSGYRPPTHFLERTLPVLDPRRLELAQRPGRDRIAPEEDLLQGWEPPLPAPNNEPPAPPLPRGSRQETPAPPRAVDLATPRPPAEHVRPPDESPAGPSSPGALRWKPDPIVPAPPPPARSPRDSSPFPAPPEAVPGPREPPSPASPFTAPPLGAPHAAESSRPPLTPGVDPHADVFAAAPYPSAKACRSCHEQIYDEWAGSSHAYAAISPMFQKFEQTISTLTRGTIGYFCWRCHTPVGTTLQLPRFAPIYASVPAAREGVTCVACHRVREPYGKVNGERRIEPGELHDPVYGSSPGEGLQEVLAKKDHYKVKLDPEAKGPGQVIHREVIQFEQLSASEFCVSCHQVVVYPGIALEVVWQQYRASPAHAQGISCQDCHMGQFPGRPDGYATAAAAVVNDKPVNPQRRHSNHSFYGPGYSIAHPGTFPLHPDADDWTVPEWLQYDWRAGWGTESFEEQVDEGSVQVKFPAAWDNADDRMDARDIIDENLKKLQAKKDLRRQLMESSSRIDGPVMQGTPAVGRPLRFHYVVTNLNSGHNLPSGSLGAQPQLWLNVALTGPSGERLWESGFVDANGDIADVFSSDVAAKRVPRDVQLFNLQTKFLITHVKGTDREFFLPVNVDIDQLPFIRPSGFPITVMNHPPFIRMEAHSLPPLGSRKATYQVPGSRFQRPGTYRLSVRLRSRAEPIYFMRFCRATPEMERSMNEWMLDFHENTFEFFVP